MRLKQLHMLEKFSVNKIREFCTQFVEHLDVMFKQAALK